MNDTEASRVSAEERSREISVLIGRLAGELSVAVNPKIYDAVISPLLVSAATLAESPYEGDSLRVRQSRADRALARLREAAKVVTP